MLKMKTITVNDQICPLGIDEIPLVSWVLDSDRQGVHQASYRIQVRGIWDSGEIESGQSHLVPLLFPLQRRTRYDIHITVTDCAGESAEADTFFETGLLGDFRADWISDKRSGAQLGCPIFRKTFTTDKKIASARLYASARGVYFASVNGQKVSDTYMAPGWTNYNRRIEYQTYDVTSLLGKDNSLELTLGKGWYRGEIGYYHVSNYYGVWGAVIAQLHIRYSDGSEECILTDNTWEWTTGPIRDSEIYNGETVDFTHGMDKPQPVRILTAPKDVLVAQECPAVRTIEEIPARELIHTPVGETVIDFGQNLTGFVRAKLCAPRGTQVTIAHAEVLDENSNFYTVNLRGAKATDTIICSGGVDCFQPSFTFHGFRYIKVEGLGSDLNLSDFTAVVCHSDIRKTGDFACSHKGMTQLQHNILWGQKGNFFDIPTDCPQRDERLGWTGDAQVFFNTAAFNMDVSRFFRKWMRDVRSQQNMELGCPTTVPDVIGEQGTAGWGDCCCIIPWNLYEAYGDLDLLREQYPTMKHWIDFVKSKTNEAGLWQSDFQHGDWLALDGGDSEDERVGATDVYFIANAFYANSTKLTMQAARLLGYDSEAAELEQRYNTILSAFRKEYITGTGRLVSETQTAAILALYFDLCEERHRPRILNNLVENIHRHNDHLTTGFLGTPYLCPVLSENGYHELAGKIVLQEDFPGWLFAVNMGATTVWERWNSMNPDRTISDTGMTSFNHYAYGCIGQWLYSQLCGIRKAEPAYKKSVIAPKPIAGITWAEASVETPYGLLRCRWKEVNGRYLVDVTVPCNTDAVLTLPWSGETHTLGSGTYHYEWSK
ncbi:MAG: family 78 glycoside hydrolase catalytic domain [Faecousia sp.]